jgi:hypothetical protein
LLETTSTWGGTEADIVYIYKALDSDADGFLSPKDFKQHFSVPTTKKGSTSAASAPTEEEQLQAALALSKTTAAAAPSEAQQLEAAIMQSMQDASRKKNPEAETKPDAAVVQQLLDMGGGAWSEAGCQRAAVATNNDVERAIQWCFDHAQDPDFDKPMDTSAVNDAAVGGGAVVADPGVVQEVVEMGGGAWSENGATRAAIAAENNLEAAIEWCLSMPRMLTSIILCLLQWQSPLNLWLRYRRLNHSSRNLSRWMVPSAEPCAREKPPPG